MNILYVLMAFMGISMTLNKDLCWLGIILMCFSMIAYAKEEK